MTYDATKLNPIRRGFHSVIKNLYFTVKTVTRYKKTSSELNS